jgi:hypothetical protein
LELESIQGVLQTHAEVAMALGGFASVVAALGRPLGEIRRQRFVALLFLALTQVLSCVIPLWLVELGITESSLWRIASLAGFLIATTSILFTVILPLRRIGDQTGGVRSAPLRHFLNVASAASLFLLPLNALGFPWSPSFALYYASLMISAA